MLKCIIKKNHYGVLSKDRRYSLRRSAEQRFLRNPPLTNLCQSEKTGLNLCKTKMQRKKQQNLARLLIQNKAFSTRRTPFDLCRSIYVATGCNS